MRIVTIVLLTMLATAVALAIAFVPLANIAFTRFEPEVREYLQARYPQLRFESIELSWQDGQAVISARDFSSDFDFSASEVRVPIELGQSLRQARLVSGNIELQEPKLRINLAEGATASADLAELRSALEGIGGLTWRQAQIELIGADSNLSLSSSGDFNWQGQQVALQGSLGNDLGQQARFRFQSDLDAASGDLYFSSSNWSVPTTLIPAELGLNAVRWSGETWLERRSGDWSAIRWRNNFLELGRGQQSLMLQGGSGTWNREQRNLNFDDWRHASYPLLNGRLLLEYEDGVRLSLQQLALSPWLNFLAENRPQLQHLQALQPQGVLQRLQLRSRDAGGDWQAQLADLSWAASADNPGLTAVDAKVDGSWQGDDLASSSYRVQAELSTLESTFSWPLLFSESLSLSRAQGRLEFDGSSDDWDLRLRDIRLRESSANAVAMDARVSASGAWELNLSSGGQQLSSIYQLVPDAIPETTYATSWLRANTTAAGIDALRLQMRQDSSSSAAANLRWNLDINASAVDGRFAPDWPPFQADKLRVSASDQVLVVLSPRLTTGNLAPTAVEATLADDNLAVKALVSADIAEQLVWLQGSPLAEQLPQNLLQLDLRGPALSAINFRVDLNSGAIAEQNSIVRLQGLGAELPGQLSLERLQGDLELLAAGWQFERMTALLNGAEIEIYPRGDKFVLAGELAPAQLLPDNMLALAAFVSGSSYFQALIGLEDDGVDLAIASSGEGITLTLPPPLTKAATAHSDFSLSLTIKPDDYQLGKLQFQGVNAAWIMPADAPPSWALAYGTALPPLTPGRTALSLHLQEIDLQSWTPLALLLGATNTGTEFAPPILDIDIARVRYQGYSLRDLRLSSAAAGAYQISSNKFDGTLKIADVWDLNFSTLELPTLGGASDDASDSRAWDLALLLPEFDLQVDELYYKQKLRGNMQARGRQQAEGGYRVAPWRLQHPELNLSIDYAQSSTDNIYRNALSLVVEGTNINPVADNLSSEQAYFAGSVTWNGAIAADAIKGGDGALELKLADGLIQGDRPNAFINFLGLISIDKILQRLRLDFSDVNAEGTTFSRLEANMTLASGRLYSDQPLILISNAGNVSLSGSIDFPANYMDQRLQVTLPLSKSLPIAAIIAGAPQLAPAFWLTDRLAAHTINRFTSASYTLRGDLADPELVLERLFNDAVE